MELQQKVEQKIVEIRREKVMLDIDLAAFYEVEKEVFYRLVMKNRKRFSKDVMFRITENEWKKYWSHIILSSSISYRGRLYLPYVFTQKGVAILVSVLKREKAI